MFSALAIANAGPPLNEGVPQPNHHREGGIPGGELGWGQGSLRGRGKSGEVRYELLSGSRVATRCQTKEGPQRANNKPSSWQTRNLYLTYHPLAVPTLPYLSKSRAPSTGSLTQSIFQPPTLARASRKPPSKRILTDRAGQHNAEFCNRRFKLLHARPARAGRYTSSIGAKTPPARLQGPGSVMSRQSCRPPGARR